MSNLPLNSPLSLSLKNQGVVISLALNGYQYYYHELLLSHRRYAHKLACPHWCITKPLSSSLGMECAWLKLLLIQSALDQGFDWVLFLDADTQVHAHCPDFRLQAEPQQCIFLAQGYSGQLNSGVMIVKNSRPARQFIWQVLNHEYQDEVDPIGWGENGHIITCCRGFSGLSILDKRWNNNHQKQLDDYIRHYSYGPLQAEFKPKLSKRCAFAAVHYPLAIYKRLKALNNATSRDKNRDKSTTAKCTTQNQACSQSRRFALDLQMLYGRVQAAYPYIRAGIRADISMHKQL